MDKNFYNTASASKLGWEPSWFGAAEFDDTLVENIEKFQEEHDLQVDGLCGPVTYRRVVTARQALMELAMSNYESKINNLENKKKIICEGKGVEIEWDKVVNLANFESLELPQNCYRYQKERTPTMIVTHWDAALSAKSCFSILKNRGISSHFVIDNDGTIYQMVDTCNVGWHAGNRKVNNVSIGIDFSNAYYAKYQNYYVRKGFGPRPVLEDSVVHGVKLNKHLGYYPVQVEAYKALVKCLSDQYDIPLVCPLDDEGAVSTSVHEDAKNATFKGVVSHYHLTRRKIDCAGLPLEKILSEIRN
jgi:hypothetical protein